MREVKLRGIAPTTERGSAPGPTRSRFGAWWLVVAVLVSVPAAASAQFSVYPVMIELAASDRVATAAFTVENNGTSSMEGLIYLSDYDRVENGDHVYMDYGAHEYSCGDRLEAFPDQLAVAPGGSGEVRLRLAPGSDTCWGVVFVEQRTLTPSGITVAQRIGVKVLVQRPNLEREGQVVGMAADTTSEPAALLVFENQGVGALDLRGEIEVRSLTGAVLAVVPVAPFRVLPGRRRAVRVSLDEAALEPGRYVLVGIMEFDGEYLAGGQTLIEVRP